MAKYLLINKQVLQFLGARHETQGCFGVRRNENDAKINFVPVIRTTASTEFTKKILQGGYSQTSLNLGIKVFIPESIPTGSTNRAAHVAVEANGENHILYKIICMSKRNVKLNLEITNFGVMTNQGTMATDLSATQVVDFKAEGCEIFQSRRFLPACNPVQPVPLLYSSVAFTTNFPQTLTDLWKNGNSFVGTFSIFVVIDNFSIPRELSFGTKNLQKLLHESVETDINLVSNDGRIAKCHRAILVSSKILGHKLSRTNGLLRVDVMKHLSLECISAILSYIYYGGTSKFSASVEIALQVLKAAAEFQLVELVEDVKNYLEVKTPSEFSANDAVKFFIIAKSIMVVSDSHCSTNYDNDASVSSGIESESQEGNRETECRQRLTGKKQASHAHDQKEDDGDDDDEYGSTDLEKRDESEPERNSYVCIPHGRGKGILLSLEKRRAVYNDGQESSKRLRMDQKFYEKVLKTPRNQTKASVTKPNEILAEINGNDVRDILAKEKTQNNLVIRNENIAGDQLHFVNVLKTQAEEVILWHLNNNRNSFLNDAVDYSQFQKSPKLLLEFLKLSLKFYPQQE